MSLTKDVLDALRERIDVRHRDDFETRVVRFDGPLIDFVSKSGTFAGKPALRIALLEQSPAGLGSSGVPYLQVYNVRIDVVVANVTSSNLEDKYEVLDEIMDRLAVSFLFDTSSAENWVLAGTRITDVRRGVITPDVAASADYVSRGFNLTLNAR